MNISDAKFAIQNAKETNTHFVFKKLFTDTPTWDEVFNHLEYEWFRKPNLNFPDSWNVNGGVATQRGPFYGQVRDAVFHKKYQNVVKFFNEVFNQESPGGGMYLDLIANRDKVDSHPDPADNLHWQVIGTTTWEFRVDVNYPDSEPQDVIKLEPGDVLFIPDGLCHSVYSNTARCGMTIPYSIRRGVANHG